MANRTLGVALWEYRDHDGQRHRAYYGETFELPDSEIKRGDRAEVFAPVPNGTPAAPEPATVADGLPAKTSTNRALVDWLVEHRSANRETIKGFAKAELWSLIEQPESVELQQDSNV
jgi:hypothetical protein